MRIPTSAISTRTPRSPRSRPRGWGDGTLTLGRALATSLSLAALATVLAVLSCWRVGWLSDDWVMLLRAQTGVLFEEPRHVSFPRRLLWWGAVQGLGPWPFRLVALGCHLVASLGVLPRVAALMFPHWPRSTCWAAGLVLLALPITLEPLVWASAVPYPILELELLTVAHTHLRWPSLGGSIAEKGCYVKRAFVPPMLLCSPHDSAPEGGEVDREIRPVRLS